MLAGGAFFFVFSSSELESSLLDDSLALFAGAVALPAAADLTGAFLEAWPTGSSSELESEELESFVTLANFLGG